MSAKFAYEQRFLLHPSFDCVILITGKEREKEMDMIVYRVENKHGIGPYYGTDDWSDWQTRHHVPPLHPAPLEDCITSMRKKELCGFSSFKKLRDWFNSEELAALSKLGFKVRRISVPRKKVKFGKKQVVFKKGV